ncbi:carbon-nitrogen hydrolase family protein [Yinghuangia soli]|uniref:Carbon-nitrogen hydrolase family protein n=1 Tax=Yinghuangia soli TaxID=2908204 RepID=A0AA41Q000_9ACTN|nr:carbon-nitrogen hydrolase family protein [Yinghuangia soli]MCF2528791.1 carbon-nitrogen hydrolase family protein [Yinghuangia soli]
MIDYDIRIKAAAVQAEPVWFDADATIGKSIDLIAEAARHGADLIAFPEIFVPGYPWQLWVTDQTSAAGRVKRYLANGMQLGDARMRRIMAAARDHGIHVVMGYVEIAGSSAYMSQMFVDDRGNLVGNRRKLKPTHVERGIFGDGNGSDLQVWPSRIGRIGALNCWEHFQPLERFTLAALHEQIHVASWPSFASTRPDGLYLGRIEPNEAATRLHAIETGSFVLCATQVTSQSALDAIAGEDPVQRGLIGEGGGFARIFHPTGMDMAKQLSAHEEGIVYADLDLNDILAAKSFIDIVGQYSRPDVFDLRVDVSTNPWLTTHGGAAAPGPASPAVPAPGAPGAAPRIDAEAPPPLLTPED